MSPDALQKSSEYSLDLQLSRFLPAMLDFVVLILLQSIFIDLGLGIG
jgi:hypothetical protein